MNNKRSGDQYVHENFKVRKDFARQTITWTSLLALIPILISLGWLPPVTSADMVRHITQHEKEFVRLDKKIEAHRTKNKHDGAARQEQVEQIRSNIAELELRSAARDRAQQIEVGKIQVDIATLKEQAKTTVEGIQEIKKILQNR